MRLLFLIFAIHSVAAQAQLYNSKVNDIASSASLITQHLKKFDALGIKEPGNPELNKTRDWLLNYYEQLGYTPKLDSFKLNIYQMYNVIAEKKGTSDQYIIVCGHYDTRNGVGANDNGSGVAVIMEMARLLFDIPTKYSIRFINFSGEESGLLGSTHYANNVVGANDSNLFLVFNIDQLGGSKGQNDNFKIKCESDQDDNPNSNNAASLAITQKLAKVLGLYTTLTPVLDKAYASDYVPFEKLGYTITGLYQYSYDPFNHTSNDLIENMDTVSFKEIGKGSIACLLHLAEASFLASTKEVKSKPIAIYPNPSNGKFNVQFGDNSVNATHYSIHSIDGRIIRSGKIIKNEIDLKNTLLPGIYVIEIHNFSNILSYHKIQIIAD